MEGTQAKRDGRVRDFSAEVEEALRKGRIGAFVHIDLRYFQVHVHDGAGKVKWDGKKWTGLGDALKAPFAERSLGHSNPRNLPSFEAHVSLPMDRMLGEALIHGYYVNRKIRINLCALNEDGQVLKRVRFGVGTIIKCSTADSNTITLHAQDMTLSGSSNPIRDPNQDKEYVYKAGVRHRFKQNVMGVVVSQAKGDMANAIADFLPLGSIVSNFLSSTSGRLYRLVRQRWSARNTLYRIETDPVLRVSYLGGLLKTPLGGRFRAYTEKEAITRFHAHVAKRIWRVPRSFLQVPLRVNGRRLPAMINLDHFRKQDDPKKWSDTDPAKTWGNG